MPKTVPVVEYDRPSGELLLQALTTDLSRFTSIKGVARIAYQRGDRNQAADHVVMARYPDRLRIETLGLFGTTMMLAATDGTRSTVLLPGEGQAYTGPPDSGFLQRVAKLPMTTESIIAIMLCRPEIINWHEYRVEYLPDGISRLVLEEGDIFQEIDFDPLQQIVRVAYIVDTQTISLIRYGEYEHGFPRKIDLDLSSAGLKVTVDYDDIETNVVIDDALFRLEPTAAYTVNPFPD